MTFRRWRYMLLGLIAAAILAACAASISSPASCGAAESGTTSSATARALSLMLGGQEPVSQWLANPRPEDAPAAADDGGTVYQSPYVPARRPRLLERLLHPDGCDGGPDARQRESWLRRPLNVTWLLGYIHGSPVIGDWLSEKGGMFGGVRLGWDFDHYWGAEFGLGFGSIAMSDSTRAQQAQQWNDTQAGYAPDDPYRQRFDGTRYGDVTIFDVSLLFYPWGDTPVRPYFTVGLGGTRVSFMDRLAQSYDMTLLTLPVGIGLKYHWTDWLALRFEVADNIGFAAGGVDTLHHLTIVGAAEIRFGGSRRSYWPWVPGRRVW